jgi:type IV pilus assembly protein PilA
MKATYLTLALALAACGSKERVPSSTPPIDTKAADALWAFAPAQAQVGVVLGDGVGGSVRAGLIELIRLMGARTGGREVVAMMRGELAGELPFDILDPAAWQRAGIDLGKGAAAFIDEADTHTLLILPVGDRAAFRALSQAKVDTVDGREVDRLDQMMCVDAAGRYLCARDLAVIDAAVAKHDSPLAARVAGLPAELRGNFEVVADLARIPDAREGLAEAHMVFQSPGLLAIAARIGSGAVTVRFWLEAKRGEPIGTAIGNPGGDPAASLTGGAIASSFRVRLPMAMLLAQSGAPASIPIPGEVDLRKDLLDQLTGDYAFHTVGRGLLAGVLAAGVKNGGRVAEAIAALCAAGQKNAPPGVTIEPADGGCRGSVDLTTLVPGDVQQILQLPHDLLKVDASIAVRGEVLALTTGDVPKPQGSPAAAAGSAGAREILGGSWHGVIWARSLDPFAGASDEIVAVFKRLMTQGPDGDQGWNLSLVGRWALAHVYEVGLAGALRDDGIHGLVQVTTFAADPPEVYQAYEAAVNKELDGDGAGYRAALADLASKHGDSLAGKQAKLIAGGTPIITGSTGILAAIAIPAFLKYIKKSKSSEAQIHVRKLYDGARALVMEMPSGAGLGGATLPADVGPTPPVGACCQGEEERCAPTPAWWDHPTWVALEFSVDDPHYYSYQFSTQTVDGAITFTVRAIGDLDCDGVYSTFTAVGRPDSDGSLGMPEIQIDNELE